MDVETVEQIEVALRRECPHERCIGREALVDAAKRIIPPTADWIVKSDGELVQLYALSEAAFTGSRLRAMSWPPRNPRSRSAQRVTTG
jgi:hypothetical protein